MARRTERARKKCAAARTSSSIHFVAVVDVHSDVLHHLAQDSEVARPGDLANVVHEAKEESEKSFPRVSRGLLYGVFSSVQALALSLAREFSYSS